MTTEPLSFASEAEKIKAMEALPETPDNEAKLIEIRNAPIGKPAPSDPNAPKDPPPAVDPPKPDATPPAADQGKPEDDEVFTVKRSEIPLGYKSVADWAKATQEKEDLIQRQQGFIKEKLSASQELEAIRKRADAAEAALHEMQLKVGAGAGAAPSGAATQTKVELDSLEAELAAVAADRAELDKMVEADSDNQFTAEYQQKMRSILARQNTLQKQEFALLKQFRDEITETKGQFEEVGKRSQEETYRKQQENEVLQTMREMDSLGAVDEFKAFKVSRPYSEIETDYVKWRNDVALAYLGRPAAGKNELFEALDQLEKKNPELLQKCKMAGIEVEPTPEIANYQFLAKALDYRDGWRRDAVTGQLTRLTRVDPATGQRVPIVAPDLKTALQQMRVETGYYKNLADEAFQRGASSVLRASQRRDVGVAELDNRSNAGQSGDANVAWAMMVLADESTEEEAIRQARKGNTKLLDDINKARQIVNLKPMTVGD